MKSIYCISMASLVLHGCTSFSPAVGPSARAELQATRGNAVTGHVRFSTLGQRVRVEGEVRGLQAGQVHGFHIHEKGDCSSGDGLSTGGHFNPQGHSHGAHGQGQHHAGDLPSLIADAQGMARFSYESSSISVGQAANDVIGRGLIVHRDPDDFKTQPTGNAGPRLACAVITRD
jgi:Cu-Zn family superoxide dismutase